MITISKAEHGRLVKRDELLGRLMAAGVENSGYFVTAGTMKSEPQVKREVVKQSGILLGEFRAGSIIKFDVCSKQLEGEVISYTAHALLVKSSKGSWYVPRHKVLEVIKW